MLEKIFVVLCTMPSFVLLFSQNHYCGEDIILQRDANVSLTSEHYSHYTDKIQCEINIYRSPFNTEIIIDCPYIAFTCTLDDKIACPTAKLAFNGEILNSTTNYSSTYTTRRDLHISYLWFDWYYYFGMRGFLCTFRGSGSNCGYKPLEEKAIDGTISTPHTHPWAVRIETSGGQCGGVIISGRYILTVAHCIYNVTKNDVTVYVGEHNTTKNDKPYEKVLQPDELVVHARYNVDTHENDIALIRFDSPIEFNDGVVPICLPASDIDLTGREAILVGWGAFEDGQSEVLREVNLQILSKSDCESKLPNPGSYSLPSKLVCAHGAHEPEANKDGCRRDFGGPLTIDENGQHVIIIGVLSWGVAGRCSQYPSMYTSVSSFIDWIQTNTQRI